MKYQVILRGFTITKRGKEHNTFRDFVDNKVDKEGTSTTKRKKCVTRNMYVDLQLLCVESAN